MYAGRFRMKIHWVGIGRWGGAKLKSHRVGIKNLFEPTQNQLKPPNVPSLETRRRPDRYQRHSDTRIRNRIPSIELYDSEVRMKLND